MSNIDRDAVIEAIKSVEIQTYSFGGQTYEDCVGTVTKIIDAIRALKSQPTQLSAKQQYDSITQAEGVTYSPIKRLELFLSCALKGQDWLDVEPFIADLTAQKVLSGEVGWASGFGFKSILERAQTETTPDPRDEALRLARSKLARAAAHVWPTCPALYGELKEALAAIDEVMKG